MTQIRFNLNMWNFQRVWLKLLLFVMFLHVSFKVWLNIILLSFINDTRIPIQSWCNFFEGNILNCLFDEAAMELLNFWFFNGFIDAVNRIDKNIIFAFLFLWYVFTKKLFFYFIHNILLTTVDSMSSFIFFICVI